MGLWGYFSLILERLYNRHIKLENSENIDTLICVNFRIVEKLKKDSEKEHASKVLLIYSTRRDSDIRQ